MHGTLKQTFTGTPAENFLARIDAHFESPQGQAAIARERERLTKSEKRAKERYRRYLNSRYFREDMDDIVSNLEAGWKP